MELRQWSDKISFTFSTKWTCKVNDSEAAPMSTSHLEPHSDKCCNNRRPIQACVSTGQGLPLSKGRKQVILQSMQHTNTHRLMPHNACILHALHFILQDMFTQKGLEEDDCTPNNPCLHCAAVKTQG